jgi:hypothetical protein
MSSTVRGKSTYLRPHLEALEPRIVPGVIVELPPPGYDSVGGPGFGFAQVVAQGTTKKNNDNVGKVGQKQNWVSNDVNFAKVDYIDRVFQVENSKGVTEYRFEDQVFNLTGKPWIGFHYELGFGTGANFKRSTTALDMDWPDRDPTPTNITIDEFRKLVHGQYTIDWSQGDVLDKNQVSFFWQIDVPDSDPLNLPQSALIKGGYKFTLRAVPDGGAAKAAANEEEVSINSNLMPASSGQPVTFKANVAGNPGVVPTGTITFLDGSVQLASVGLSDGSASFTTSSLTSGNHYISASYVDPTRLFSANASSPLTQVITGTPPTVPSVTSVGPNVGSTGGTTSVTLTGTNFTYANQVFFGGIAASSFTVNSSTSITVAAPPEVAGTEDVRVGNSGGLSALGSGDRYTFTAASAPSISSLGTTSGTTAGGTSVTINGANFSGASSVMFGSVASPNFVVNSDGQITAFSPPQAAITSEDVTVVTLSGTSAVSSNDQFAVSNASSPTVSGLSLSSGTTAGGSVVTISGANYTGATVVSFGSMAASSFTVLSDGSIVATAPAEAAGTVDVTVTTFAGTSATGSSDHFTYNNASPPTVSALSVASGSTLGGDTVVLTGTGFTGATGVSFGSTTASFIVLSDTAIQAFSPAVSSAGAVNVTVTTYAGTSTSTATYTYTAASAPVITGLSATSGSTAGSTVVVISGSGFSQASEVDFGGAAVFNFTVNSDSQITVLTPPWYAGTVDVQVVSAAGTSASTSNDRFTYTAASTPAVSSLDVTGGTTAGGTVINLTGTDFTGAYAVSFGDVAATSFTVNSPTSITAVAPPQAVGTVDVTVTTYTGTSESTSSDQFTYSAASAPTVTSLGITGDVPNGGKLVGINGTNFTGATAVNFGSVAADGFTVVSDNLILAYDPAQAAGTFDVTVTTFAGTSATSGADYFTYSMPSSGPTVNAITPSSGTTAGGTVVTILGAGFTGATGVSFGSVAASGFTVNSDSSITATAPMEASGTVDITVTTFAGTSSTSSADQFTYNNVTASAPAVTAVSPSTGSTAGGQLVTITGTNFTGTSAVDFGGTAASAFTIVSATTITATAPAGSAGTIDITVTTNNGTSATGSADHFTYLSTPAPGVTSLGTSTGTTAGGTSVAITGTDFTGATAVMFGNVAAASVTVNSATSITATSPAEPTGVVDITVTTPSGPSATLSSDQFTYTLASAPTISSLGTSSGSTAGGTSVAITGTNFTGATGVYFGGVAAASFTVNSSTSITATSPVGYVGTADVRVATYAGMSATNSNDRFSYTAASTPAVSSLSTSSGTTAGGTSVTITGTSFTGATGVMFGNVAAASFTVNSSTSITAISPPEPAGTVDIQVTTTAGTSAPVSADHFTVSAASAPTVSSLGTSSGMTAGGTSVNITGTNFTGATEVDFGTIAAAFTVNSSTSITATAPPQAAGTVDVTVTTYAGTSATGSSDHFTYTAASAPTVGAVTASSGSAAGGDVVTVTGTNLAGATKVSFGSTDTTSFQVLSASALLVTSPAGAAGTVDVTVTTYAGTSATSSADQFTYNAVSTPSITSLSTSSGSTGGGTLVTISGSHFLDATGLTIGNTPVAFTVVSENTIVITAPPMAAGTYDITVSAPGVTSALGSADRFEVDAAIAPAVTSLGTSSGSSAGGTSVTITGTNFTGASGVSFGTVAATFTVVSDTSIVAVSPSQPTGTVDVIVTTPTGTSLVSSSDHFTYSSASAPTVSSVTPSSGSTAGGTSVTILGSHFTGATAVNFGTVSASFTFQTDGYLTAVVPAQAAGTVDVTVVTPSGTSSTSSSDHYTYSAASAPTVTSVTTNGVGTAGGDQIVVFGSNFTGASAVNFGSTAALSFTVLSATALTAISPAGSATTVDITVVTPSGTSSTGSADHFTYSAGSAPTVTSLATSSGSSAGGAVVIITGTNFTGATSVSFGSVPATTFIVNSSTQITAVSPSEAAGTFDVTVTTPYGTSATSSSDQFTYSAASAPSVTGVSPSKGPSAGGTWVTITGSNFTGATSVMFGSVAASSFRVNDDGSIVALSPAESAATVDITVTTASGTSSTGSSDQFTFVAPDTLTDAGDPSISATHGSPWSGTVALFTSGVPHNGSYYHVIIVWGDGTSSFGSVAPPAVPNTSHAIGGGHTYASAGTYTVTVYVWADDGSTLTLTGTATVADARPLTPDDDEAPRLIDDPWRNERGGRLARGLIEWEDLLQATSNKEDSTTTDPARLRTDGDILVVTPDYGVLIADYDAANTPPPDDGPAPNRKDAALLAASDGPTQDDDSTIAKVTVTDTDEADAFISTLDDLVTLPVAIVDELLATLWPC